MPENKKITPLDLYQAGHGDEHSVEEEIILTEAEKELVEKTMKDRPQEIADLMVSVLKGDDVSAAEPILAVAAYETLGSLGKAMDSMLCDVERRGEACDKKHCPVCGQHYKIMVFNHPGPCRELCRKEEKNDHWPARSSLVKGK